MEPLTVVIADDHQFFRDGVRALLDAQLNMECLGEAATGEEVIRLSAELQPDVVLMDVQMPGMSGVEATRQIVSSREGEILALLEQGYKNAEIADRLVISPKTVRNYVSNIISKLQVADRAQAILRAKDAGFGAG